MLKLRMESRRATRQLGAALADKLVPGDVLWLEGDLGAGKTFFARGLLRALGVPQAIAVTSPTFSLVHEYQARLPIAHLDLYRLGAVDELDELGVVELMEHRVVLVEWGERFRAALGERGIELRLTALEAENQRMAVLRGLDPRGQELLADVSDDARIIKRALHPTKA